MKPTFAIGIPTLNRGDLLLPTLLKYQKDFPNTKIYIVDNGNQIELQGINFPNVSILFQKENLGVAKSWNLLCEQIYLNHDYAIILNDDIYLGKTSTQIDTLLLKEQRLYTNPMDWSVFILPKTTFEKVGKFDEQFYPAYCEDNDFVYRMKLMGYWAYKTPLLIPSIHRTSQTLAKDFTLQSAFHENKQKYIEKWGGEPDFERYKTPYNKK